MTGEKVREASSLEDKFITYIQSLDPHIFNVDRINTVSVSVLDGGHSNVTYLTKVNEKLFVMRFHPQQDHGDYTAGEYRKLKEAAGHHAPKALYLGKPDFIDSSVLIMEYIEGRHKDFNNLSTTEVKNFASAVADLHSITRKGMFAKTPDLPEDVEGTYYDYLQSHIDNNITNRLRDADSSIYKKDETVIHEAEAKLEQETEKHKDAFAGNEFSYSHNDIVMLNVLWSNDRPTLIDWEAPCYGDRADEIAYIFAINNTSEQFQQTFLEEYEQQVADPTLRERVNVYTLKNRLFDLAWAISKLDEEAKNANPLMKKEEGLYRQFYDVRLKGLEGCLEEID